MLSQGFGDDRPIQLPIPTVLPGQGLGQVCRHRLPGKLVHQRLLLGLQHFQQQAALRPLALQGAQQPQLQRMVVGVVVLFTDQHPWGGRQTLQQLLWADQLAAGKLDDMPQFGMAAPFTALPGRQRRQAGLAAPSASARHSEKPESSG